MPRTATAWRSVADGAAVLPESRPRTRDGRYVELKAHRAQWSGRHPANSVAALRECLELKVARAEVDLRLGRDGRWIISHDESDAAPAPALSALVELLVAVLGPTVVELDAKDLGTWPRPAVDRLARELRPVRSRVVVAGCQDANLRRLADADPEVPLGFNPGHHLDWAPPGHEEPGSPPRGLAGYADAQPPPPGQPLADHLRTRFRSVLGLVPGARELHLRLAAFERLLADGVPELVAMTHDAGLVLDVWTLNAGSPAWRERLALLVDQGVDIVTTDTGPALAAELRRR